MTAVNGQKSKKPTEKDRNAETKGMQTEQSTTNFANPIQIRALSIQTETIKISNLLQSVVPSETQYPKETNNHKTTSLIQQQEEL